MGRRLLGTIRKLPSGRYQARYPGPDGRMRNAPETFARKSDARHFDALKNSMIFLYSSAVSGQRTRMWCITTSHSRSE